jgi:hypothetical protein
MQSVRECWQGIRPPKKVLNGGNPSSQRTGISMLNERTCKKIQTTETTPATGHAIKNNRAIQRIEKITFLAMVQNQKEQQHDRSNVEMRRSLSNAHLGSSIRIFAGIQPCILHENIQNGYRAAGLLLTRHPPSLIPTGRKAMSSDETDHDANEAGSRRESIDLISTVRH